jgi:hypothetical protein
MPENLDDLLEKRSLILGNMCELGDFRRGSITTTTGKCGTPSCHCHQSDDPGHGPSYRLTRKAGGKTVTETFRNAGSLEKAQTEVAEFHKFRELCEQLTEINEQICRLRPVQESAMEVSSLKKKPRRRYSRKSARK